MSRAAKKESMAPSTATRTVPSPAKKSKTFNSVEVEKQIKASADRVWDTLMAARNRMSEDDLAEADDEFASRLKKK